jgi:hypothetical protein
LLKAVPAISAEIEKQTGNSMDDVATEEPAPLKQAKASKKAKMKANIEATSDEEED